MSQQKHYIGMKVENLYPPSRFHTDGSPRARHAKLHLPGTAVSSAACRASRAVGLQQPPSISQGAPRIEPLVLQARSLGGASGAGLTVLLYQPPWENNGGVPFCLPEVPRVRDDGRRHPVQTGHTAVIT